MKEQIKAKTESAAIGELGKSNCSLPVDERELGPGKCSGWVTANSQPYVPVPAPLSSGLWGRGQASSTVVDVGSRGFSVWSVIFLVLSPNASFFIPASLPSASPLTSRGLSRGRGRKPEYPEKNLAQPC